MSHNAQESRDSLRFLSNFGLVNLEVQPVVFEIPFGLFAVDILYIQVGDSQDSAPVSIAVGQFKVLWIENAV